jgi:hypothetical protein
MRHWRSISKYALRVWSLYLGMNFYIYIVFEVLYLQPLWQNTYDWPGWHDGVDQVGAGSLPEAAVEAGHGAAIGRLAAPDCLEEGSILRTFDIVYSSQNLIEKRSTNFYTKK